MAEHICPNCGNHLPPEAAFCGYCGAPVSSRPRSRRLFFLGGGILLVVLLAAGGYFFGDQLVDWFAQGGRVADADAELVAVGEPTAAVPAAAGDEPDEVPDEPDEERAVTSSPTIPPTKTAAPTQTSAPTPPPTLTPTPTLTPSPIVTPTLSPGPQTMVIGYSVNERPIEAVRFGTGENAIIFIGGIHAGFAPGSVLLAQRTVDYLTEKPGIIPDTARVYVILSMNPDSANSPGQLAGRLNARGVDLNRNWACEWRQDPLIDGRTVPDAGGGGPLSEPETQAVANFVLEQEPVAVIFWQARAAGGLVSPGGCGAPGAQSYDLTVIYAQRARYRWDDYESLIGQVVPGDASNWFDLQGIPAAAVLMPSFAEPDWERNRVAIEEVLAVYGSSDKP